jgi:hypothetical protein
MCTVTFIPVREGILLASNRDEKHFRSSAFPPATHPTDQGLLLYPKDGDAGGTWIATNESGQAVVFLNGGFVPHQSTPPYRKSRGRILLDIIGEATPVETCMHISLEQIEPFTAVIWAEAVLHEFRWDGMHRHLRKLSHHKPHIWSSVTLYDPAVIAKRESWFHAWIERQQQATLDDLMHFHQFTGDGDQHNDLLMNRNGHVYTVSITGLHIGPHATLMKYLDLKNNQRYDQSLMTRSVPVSF